jgi:hypothetical protein
VTSYQVDCSDGRRVVVDGDDIRVADGALMIGRGQPPRVVAVFAPRSWQLASTAEAGIVFADPPQPAAPPRPPRLYPAIETPDQIANKPW